MLTKAGGVLGPIGDLLGWIMDLLFRFTNMFGIVNIGPCIILFTLVTKVLMIPLTIKQQKSSKLMAVMQPELTAIQKKYKGKENDQKAMMMMQTETKAVYEKYGTSMTCLLYTSIFVPLNVGKVGELLAVPALYIEYRILASDGSCKVVVGFDEHSGCTLTGDSAGDLREQLRIESDFYVL